MSASEKLKTLEPEVVQGFFPKNVRTLLHALPQIVAVVEAAEGIQKYPRGDDSEIHVHADLTAALSALEEALP